MVNFFIAIITTFVASFLFGLERQRSHKQVAFGTFIFVSTGSCVLAIVAQGVFPESPLPLLGAIMTGIGFLGAGALIKDNDKIFGFTTAASIWVFAAFGISIGMGYYGIGGLLYAMIWVVVYVDRYLEKNSFGSYRKKIVILSNKIDCEKEVRDFLKEIGVNKTRLIRFDFDKDKKETVFSYFVEGKIGLIKNIPEKLKGNPVIIGVRFE